MLKEIFTEYKELGLQVIPIEWDTVNKQPVSHRLWGDGKPMELYEKELQIYRQQSGVNQ